MKPNFVNLPIKKIDLIEIIYSSFLFKYGYNFGYGYMRSNKSMQVHNFSKI